MLSLLNYLEIPQLRNANFARSHATFEICTLWRTDFNSNPLFSKQKAFAPSELEPLMKVYGHPFQFLSVAYMDVIITSC